MWTRVYLLLLVVRLYLAISPSYIHPDENFQGPEIVAGNLFSFPHHLTWEFTTEHPIRSISPLWIVYGIPMTVLQWVWTETGKEQVAPEVIYYTLRVLMFLLSFVLEDWALHELIHSPKQRRLAVILVASSYVTWTYQTHTFSNSIETLIVAWTLVMIQRILDNKHRSSLLSSSILGALLTFGLFNRITFPAFIFVPGLYLIPHLLNRPFSLLAVVTSTAITSILAISVDTAFYSTEPFSLSHLLHHPTITPINSLFYNTSTANLSPHGLHPRYQHLIASLPLLLGPGLLLLLNRPRFTSLPFLSAVSGTALLSAIPHQEPRFLLAVVPPILASVKLPPSKNLTKSFLAVWIIFNAVLGILMGIYHQGGVIPAQIWLGQQNDSLGLDEVLWWRTYSPPVWLLGGNNITTTDLMGAPFEEVMKGIDTGVGGCGNQGQAVGLVAPASSAELDPWIQGEDGVRGGKEQGLVFREIWRYRRHLNLDDLDIGEEGVGGTLRRVVGRRGLVIWSIRRDCNKVAT